ncbi:MAG: 30S ribosomal protein S1 [Acidobacteria bacterium]|nr:30S ribosomal protein S1 [Acidobacteriota bacterium]
MSDLEKASLMQSEEAQVAEPKSPQAEGEEFDRFLNSYSQLSDLPPGTFLKGRIVKITDSEAIVDIGYKCEGVIPIEEFKDEQGNIRVQPDEEVDVLMESAEERDGYVVLSREKAKKIQAWEHVEAAYQRQTTIPARVVEKIKGGLVVDIGVRAFLPGSHVGLKPVRDLDAFVGRELPCRIIKFHKKRNNIVVSHKIVLEEETRSRKDATLASLTEGAVLQGKVKNITDYGAFIDLGGIDGLLHITDLSWGRVKHPSDILAVGQEVQVKVLKFDPERERVSLGLRQLSPDPWLSVAERYATGTRASGKVLNLTDYGAFVELEPGVEGLIHISELSWSKRLKHPSKVLTTGDIVEVMVLDVNPQDRRISLGLKQLERNPWTALAERCPVGTVIQGRVRSLTDFGAFVEVEDGVDGLVHVSDISWTKRIRKPAEVLKKGDSVQVVVLKIEPENQRLSLGIKQLQPDAWETFSSSYRVGDVINGKVVRKTAFGMFVELGDGLEGLCHNSEIPTEQSDGKAAAVEVGQSSAFKIIKLNLAEKKVGLSLKALQADHSSQEVEKFRQLHSSSGATTTIEEMVAMKERNPLKN